MQGNNSFDPDSGTGWRGNTGDSSASATPFERGGEGAETDSPTSGPHSARGLRRSLMKSQRNSGRLKNLVSATDTSGKGFNKPNYFAQGGQRHGMHIGSGAPPVTPAQQEGLDF